MNLGCRRHLTVEFIFQSRRISKPDWYTAWQRSEAHRGESRRAKESRTGGALTAKASWRAGPVGEPLLNIFYCNSYGNDLNFVWYYQSIKEMVPFVEEGC